MTAPFPPGAPLLEPPPPRPALRRSRTDKVAGGVAGGLAQYSGVDALLWRVGFVALTLAGGTGIAVYLLLWLLMPAGPRTPADGTPAAPPGPRSPVAGITVAGLLIVVGLMVLLTRYTGLDLGARGFLAGALLVVGLGLVASAFARGRAPRGGLIALGSVLTLALMFASSVHDWDEDGHGPGGGVGNREYQPTSVEDVEAVYRLGAGNMEIDLSEIDGDDLGGREIRIDQDLGNLEVEVPDDVAVRVVLDQDGGNTEIFGQSGDGYFPAEDADEDDGGDEDGDRDPALVLTIDHGVGNVEVSRA
ncbi:phage shock protein C (PspC) family protein [Geodermatophilus obscurus]|uniref:Phage shock protein C (PspC) family protein n=1 Tax=Geodermatophilus obscurus TaxID=1861 RepID=A0A1I5F974_9ACTN|nr:PspC domain-containing protein [Geodermatophilus obscurus]SFO20307.1 phage shock protein C (PspC) family protein [Geodermatophilus obscurus]